MPGRAVNRGEQRSLPDKVIGRPTWAQAGKGHLWRNDRFVHAGLIPSVAGVRVASRAWWRAAAAMLWLPAIFMIPMVRLRRVAMAWGPRSAAVRSPARRTARAIELAGNAAEIAYLTRRRDQLG